MSGGILSRIFGTQSERDVKKLRPTVAAINALEPEMRAMTDEQLAAQTEKFRAQLKEGKTLDELLVPAFATVREVSRRTMHMRHFDEQLMGGIAMHQGKIAEMKTGEGKTLVATLAVYLNALAGEGVHVVTVNDYLASRDSAWMGRLYKALGLTVGAITHELDDNQRRAAYACDITYGTNNEFGFDYLRDNMKFRGEDCVQRGHSFAIVDEVDSILIDEARTPLIISGPSNETTAAYGTIDAIVPQLEKGEELNADDPDLKTTTGDYIVDEKERTINLTEQGIGKVEKLLNLDTTYDMAHMAINKCVETAIKAHVLYQRDRDYIKEGDDIIIIDEFTGRRMPGRRWSDGLHQAIEAKEGVTVHPEDQTMATVTFQNYFRMYKKLAGMTGTAQEQAAEFSKIYKLDVVQIPTHKPNLRKDFNDVIYRTEDEKFRAIAREIQSAQAKGQPVLVGTTSVEKSEKLSALLTSMGIMHEVLNAKNNAREAEIIAQAGRKGAVTVSTNMAGRGTDIILGGNADFLTRAALKAEGQDPDKVAPEEWERVNTPIKAQAAREHDEVTAAGGLYVIGTERHESRRIDNQLRGRAARQGDPGMSRFFISLEDRLARVFGGDKLKNLMLRLGMSEDIPIESRIITKLVANAQGKVEEQNFMARKTLIEYDDVMNKQRELVYKFRRELLDGKDQKERVLDMIDARVATLIDRHWPERTHSYACDWEKLGADVEDEFGITFNMDRLKDIDDRLKLEEVMYNALAEAYGQKEQMIGPEGMKMIGKTLMLQIIDECWKDYLFSIDYMKQGIGLRSYAQVDPLIEYKKEAFNMFNELMDYIDEQCMRAIFNLNVAVQEPAEKWMQFPAAGAQFSAAATPAVAPDAEPKAPPPAVTMPPPVPPPAP